MSYHFLVVLQNIQLGLNRISSKYSTCEHNNSRLNYLIQVIIFVLLQNVQLRSKHINLNDSVCEHNNSKQIILFEWNWVQWCYVATPLIMLILRFLYFSFSEKFPYFVFCPKIFLFHTAKARFTKICIFKLDVRDGD